MPPRKPKPPAKPRIRKPAWAHRKKRRWAVDCGWKVDKLTQMQHDMLVDIARDCATEFHILAPDDLPVPPEDPCAYPGRPGLVRRMEAKGWRPILVRQQIERFIHGSDQKAALITEHDIEGAPPEPMYRQRNTWYLLNEAGKEFCAELVPEHLRSARQFAESIEIAEPVADEPPSAFQQKIKHREKVGEVMPSTTPLEARERVGLPSSVLAGGIADAAQDVAERYREKALREAAAKDPVEWCKQVEWVIETKTAGLQPFKPWPYQVALMRMFAQGKSVVVPKSRQTGVTTALMTCAAWAFVNKIPWHMHVVANKEEVAKESCLKIARLGLIYAKLPDDVRRNINLAGEHTTHIDYKGPHSNNYIRAHACTVGAGRSFAGNVVVMEEVADMLFAEGAYTSLSGMTGDGDCMMWLVSTYSGDGDFFCHMVDEGQDMGYEVIPIDWNLRPNRDEAWAEKQRARMGEDNFAQEHELKRIVAGEAEFDMSAAQMFAKRVSWIGGEPIPGHRYAKGIDQSSYGICRTVAVVIDLTTRPCQVVALEVHEAKSQRKGAVPDESKVRARQQIEFIERIDEKWPGPCFIDGTNEKGTAILPKVRTRKPVHFTGGSKINIVEDKVDRTKWWHVPRTKMVNNAATNVNLGNVVIDHDEFKEILKGIGSVRKGIAKKHGANVDESDAFMLALLSVKSTRRPATEVEADSRLLGVKQSKILAGIRESSKGRGRY